MPAVDCAGLESAFMGADTDGIHNLNTENKPPGETLRITGVANA
jgi:hypothetical protein